MSNFEYHKRNIIRFYEREKAEKKAEEERARATQEKKPTTPPIELFTGKAQFLEGKLGKQIHEKIIARYKDTEAITKIVFEEKEKIIKGSNPFYVVAVNEILQEQFPQFRTATQADLERILKTDLLTLKGQYEDTSLVWRSNQDPNEYLAKDIFAQFKARGIEFIEGTPYVIPLFTLKLRKDEKSQYQLAFDLTDLALQSYFTAPILNEVSQQKFNSEDIEERTGIPKKVRKEGKRILYTRNYDQYTIKNSGLSGFYLYGSLSAGSGSGSLAYSGGGGRVVLVSSEAGTQKIGGRK